MITPGVTPVEVWAPAFSWEPDERLFQVERLLSLPRCGGYYCLLCEGTVETGERKAHVKAHAREVARWRKEGKRRVEREAARRLRETNRLLAENRRHEREMAGAL